MIYRIFISLIKLKVLNLLLLIFMVVSFLGVAISSSQVYKGIELDKEIEEFPDFIYITGENLEVEESFTFVDNTELYREIVASVFEYSDDARINDLTYSVESSITIEGVSNYSFDEEQTEYFSVSHSKTNLEYTLEFPDEYDETKIYIDSFTSESKDLAVGDSIDLITETFEFSGFDDLDVSTTVLKTVEIGGILDYTEEEKEFRQQESNEEVSYDFGYIYVPLGAIADVDVNEYELNYATLTVVPNSESFDEVVAELKNNFNEDYIHSSKLALKEDLDFYSSINQFFIYMFIISIILFIVTFISLNNNINERRMQEFQLYNIFGSDFSKIQLQILIEKMILFMMSLVFAIPAYLFVLRKINNILEIMVYYTLDKESLYETLVMQSGVFELDGDSSIYNIYSAIEVDRLMVIILTMLLLIVILVAITGIQLRIRKSSIKEQRRDE